MATYTSDVLASTKMRNPKEASDELRDLEAGQQAIQRQVTGGPVTGLNRFQRQQALNQWNAGEVQRRQAAAPQAFGIAGQIDERQAGVKNQLADVYTKYQNAQANAQQQQRQQTALTDFETEQALKGIEQKKDEFDFGLYKNQSERDDALNNLWNKGVAEEALQNLAINHQLKLQDIDQYFKLIQNKMEQDFETWKNDEQIAWSKAQRNMESAASNTGLMFGALFGTAGAIIGYVAGGPMGAVGGGTMGMSMGQNYGSYKES